MGDAVPVSDGILQIGALSAPKIFIKIKVTKDRFVSFGTMLTHDQNGDFQSLKILHIGEFQEPKSFFSSYIIQIWCINSGKLEDPKSCHSGDGNYIM